jgi:hypothetical protein
LKTNSLVLLAVAVCGALFAILAPANMKDKLIGVATFATNERQCFNFHKKYFIDPDSAYFESSYILTRKDKLESYKELNLYTDPAFDKYEAMLNIQVKAKNHMGGYVTEHVECPIINGRFNEFEADSNRRNPEALFERAPAAAEAAPAALPVD